MCVVAAEAAGGLELELELELGWWGVGGSSAAAVATMMARHHVNCWHMRCVVVVWKGW